MIRSFSALKDNLRREMAHGCFVDTTVLFSATYPLGQFNEECESVFERLAEYEIPIFTNVSIRAEFLENHRRVLIGEALIDFLEEAKEDLPGPLAEKLKSHRTNFRKKIQDGKSAKMDVNQIKMFRKLFAAYELGAHDSWRKFCRLYLHTRITPLWDDLERELNLNSISVRSEDQNPYLTEIPHWDRATELVGRHGIASSDAMILNMFLCSNIPILLTADVEMAECADHESGTTKQIFMPDSAMLSLKVHATL